MNGAWCWSPRDQQYTHFFPELVSTPPALATRAICGSTYSDRRRVRVDLPDPAKRSPCPDCTYWRERR